MTCIFFILQVNHAGSPCPKVDLLLPIARQEPPQVPATRHEQLEEPQEGDSQQPVAGQEGPQAPATREEQVEGLQQGGFRQPVAGLEVPQAPATRQGQLEELQQGGSQQPVAGQEVPQAPATREEQLEELQQGGSQQPAAGQNTSQAPLCHRSGNMHKKSYIDDLTLLEKISLSDLIQKERIIGPPNFHDRFHLKLPPQKCILQHQLVDLTSFTSRQSMLLNSKKTKCLPFVNSVTKDFMPEISIVEGKYLEVIYELRLVGLVISSDMTWNAHVKYTVKRVNSVLWQTNIILYTKD